MTQQSTPRWHSPGQLQPPWWRGSPWLTASWVLGRPSSACPTLAPTTAAAVTRLDGGLTGWQLGIGTIHMLWWNEAYCGVTVYWLVQVCWGCCWFWPYQINVMVKISLTFSYVFIRKIQYKYRFGKQSCWFFLSFWRINDDSLTFSAFFFFFFFCFPRPFSPLFSTLLRSRSTKDSWPLGKIRALNGDDLPREHLAAFFSWHFLCV